MSQQQEPFSMVVSDRSMRRVQIVMAAMQAAEQTARAASQAAEGMVAQARKSLDEALGSICDANDQTLPEQYSLTIRVAQGLIIITDTNADIPPPVQEPGLRAVEPSPPRDPDIPLNGATHAGVLPEAAQGIQT